jgi:hypothetical protein
MHENDLFANCVPAAVRVIRLPLTVIEAVPDPLKPVRLLVPVLLVEKPNSDAVTPVHDSGGAKDATPKLNSDAGPLAIGALIVAVTVNEPFESYCAVALTKSCEGAPTLSPMGSVAEPLVSSAEATAGTPSASRQSTTAVIGPRRLQVSTVGRKERRRDRIGTLLEVDVGAGVTHFRA